MRCPRAQPMNMTAINHQMLWKPTAGVEPAIRTEGALVSFDFGRARREKLPGPAHYLILVRQQHANRARLSWALRDRMN